MVGNGSNKKSMAYIYNVAAFLEASIMSNLSYGVFNYVDSPDMDMNSLVKTVRGELKGAKNVGVRIPFFFGYGLGLLADFYAAITRKTLPLSSVRVRKFCASTEFSSSKAELGGFTAPYSLTEGVMQTLHDEFVNPNPDQEIFYTE